MKRIAWDEDKNLFLKRERGISFERIVLCIEQNHILDIVEHPNKIDYGHQRIFIVRIDDYVYAVPFVEDDTQVFLKTAFRSRKLQKQYLEDQDGQT